MLKQKLGDLAVWVAAICRSSRLGSSDQRTVKHKRVASEEAAPTHPPGQRPGILKGPETYSKPPRGSHFDYCPLQRDFRSLEAPETPVKPRLPPPVTAQNSYSGR